MAKSEQEKIDQYRPRAGRARRPCGRLMDETYLIVLREDGTPMEALCEGCLIVPLFLHAADAIECAQSCDDDLGKYQLKPVKIAAQ